MSANVPSHTGDIVWEELVETGEDFRLLGYHACDGSEDNCRILVPLVCRQLYYEGMPFAWKTTTFAFDHPSDFCHFVLSTSTRVDLIEQLCIILSDKLHQHGPYNSKRWRRAFRSGRLTSFTSLQGVSLILQSDDFRTTRLYPPLSFDVLNEPPYRFIALPSIIRKFQKCPLREDRTSVLLAGHPAKYRLIHDYTIDPSFPISKRRLLAEVIRHLLLDHQTSAHS